MEALGFRLVSDDAWDVNSARPTTNHVRCLIHDEHRCFAGIAMMHVQNASMAPPRYVFESLFGSNGNLRISASPAEVTPPIALPEGAPVKQATLRLCGYVLVTQSFRYGLDAFFLPHPNMFGAAFPDTTRRNTCFGIWSFAIKSPRD